MELAQVRQDIERRIAEKEDEFQVHTILRNFYIYLIQLIEMFKKNSVMVKINVYYFKMRLRFSILKMFSL